MAELTDRGKRIKDLLRIQKCVSDIISSEIDETLRGRGRTRQEIKESLYYVIDEKSGFMDEPAPQEKYLERNPK